MISGKNKDLYYTSSIDKQLNIEVVGTKIVIDNSMRERDTFALTETLNDGTELKFGSCLPNQISFTAYDMSAGLVGEILRPVETLEGNEDDPFTYGKYKILSAAPTADRTKRQVTAYDAMYDIINADVKAWYDGLTFPMTLKAFRDSFFKHLDIEQEDTTLVNDSMTVNKTLVASSSEDSAVTAESTISGKTIIEAICEINGAFGNMNRAGKFEYVILPTIVSALYPSDTLYPSDDLFPSDSNAESMSGHYITFDYEDFQSQAITQLEIRADDNTAGAIVGNAGNTYVISGNFLVSDKTGAELEQIANNVLPIMAQAAYTPIKSCTTVGNPCLELGDPIRFNTSREIVETYILQRTLTGVQSKRDSIVAQGTETHTAKVNSIRETLESVQKRTSKLERNADHLLSQYEDLEEQTSSKIEQTADAITAEVKRAQGTEGNLAASISVVAGEVSSKVSSGDVVSEINQSSEQITLRGNRLIVESNNFELDALGRVHIVDSLLYDSGDTTVEILTHDARHIALLQNLRIDLNSIEDDDTGGRLATESYVDQSIPSLSGYVNNASVKAGTAYDSVKKAVRTMSKSGKTIYGEYYTVDTSSDERIKTDISDLPDMEKTYMNFRPVIFRYKPGLATIRSDQYHYGLISQEVEKALANMGIGEKDTSLYEYLQVDKDEHYDKYIDDKLHHVNYRELHALHIQMIQKQQHEIEDLKRENKNLRDRIQDFERRLSALEGK